MRRSIHALIVSLLCLTLFVDTAKACWHRRHRSRSHATCRPVTCPSSCSQPVWRDLPPGWDGSMADVVISDRPLYEVHESTGHAGIPVECCVPCDGSAHASVDFATEVFEQPAVAHAAVPKTMAEESVVVHGPTVVIDTIPKPAAQPVAPPAAPPMPLLFQQPAAGLTAKAAEPNTSAAAEDPLPTLKPAPVVPSAITPASGAKPMATAAIDDAAATTPTSESDDATNQPTTPAPAPAPAAATPMPPAEPAPAEDLAGGPAMPAPVAEPPAENLFDEFDDEEEETPSQRPAGKKSPEPSKEPVDEEADAFSDDAAPSKKPAVTDEPDGAAAAKEPEMTEDADEEADGDAAEKPAEESDPTPAKAAPPAEDAPQEKPAEADPAAAAFMVPDEPMRCFRDATGDHQIMGWLVELHTDSVRILKANGRYTMVRMDLLSAADQAYASEVGTSLATKRQGDPLASHDTAGL